MPLTDLQKRVAKLLASNRSPDSYLAGGAALHRTKTSSRYSEDLDYFHDSEERVATAFATDHDSLLADGFNLKITLRQPGYIRALVTLESDSTKLEWAYDSAWRFFAVSFDEEVGFVLHPIDLAVNKLLALVGRDEARDFLDILECHSNILPLAALVWAASGKDPGLSPGLIMEQLKRRSRYRKEDFDNLALARPIQLEQLKRSWMNILAETEATIETLPPADLGCLYFSKDSNSFGLPSKLSPPLEKLYATLGGVIPKIS